MKGLLFSLLLLFSSQVFADYINVTGNVKLINNWEGHNGHLIKLSDMSLTNGLCERNDHYILHKNHMFLKENFSMLLTARVSGMPVTIRFSDSASNKCEDKFPRIFHIQL